MRLKDKVALITGSSRGMGKATALLFAKEGAKIIADYHVSDYEPDAEENMNKVVEEIRKIGSEVISIECDVSQEKEVKEMFNKAIKKFGKIDILVNNAGIVWDIPLLDKTIEQWKRTLETNLIGTFLCSKYAAENMLKRKSGIIINISSTNGIDANSPFSADYDASKAGIISLTKNLAEELAPNIRVNAIAPGWIDTDMNKTLSKEYIQQVKERTFCKRVGKPEEIAAVALFLASDDASFVNGSVVVADGGYK